MMVWESVALKAKILPLILLCLLISLPACYCQTIKLYKLYIGPWGVPPSEYIDLDSQGSIEENLRQDLRSIVDALIHLRSLIISPENANVYEWISSLSIEYSDGFNVLYNQKYYRILIVPEKYEIPKESLEPKLWIAIGCLAFYSAGITAFCIYKFKGRSFGKLHASSVRWQLR
jgi:hypothetical protein